jgi:hypothetical protein
VYCTDFSGLFCGAVLAVVRRNFSVKYLGVYTLLYSVGFSSVKKIISVLSRLVEYLSLCKSVGLPPASLVSWGGGACRYIFL